MTQSEAQGSEQLATWYSDDSRRYCTHPWKAVALLSDGQVVCSNADMTAKNPLGNIKLQSFREIWAGPRYQTLREAIASDIDQTEVCRGCPHRVTVPPPMAAGHPTPPTMLPRVVHVESSVACNLNCHYMCKREPIEGSRTKKNLDYDLYTRFIDELSPGLLYMAFHMGGENWIHPRAAEMVHYCRVKNPYCYVMSSTNGHFFQTEKKLRDALLSGVDSFFFSIDGTHQESYEKYRQGGDFQVAYDAMKNMVKMRNQIGRTRPLIIWGYILFEWNDSPEEMQRARELAKEAGVDYLAWHLNAGPPEISSKRYHIGSPHLHEIKDELWDVIVTKMEHHDLRLGSYD